MRKMSVCLTAQILKALWLFIPLSLNLIYVLSQEHRVMTQSCDGDWVRYGDSCYRYYTSPMTWMYAFKTCQSDNAFLTDIENADEQAFLQNLTSRTKFWISASDSVGDWFKWMWYGGIHPWGFTNWDTGQPDNSGGNEDCAVVKENGKWDDLDCSSTLPFVCKRKDTISFCDSTWKKKDGGCFKVFPDFKNWLDAQRTCQSNSATLANIDNISKQNYVFGLFRVWLIWIGGFYSPTEDVWAWTGTNLPWEYQYWGPGQPNGGRAQNCLGLAPSTGFWDDGNCVGHYIQYICERKTFYLTEDPVLTMAVEASSNEARLICAFTFNISDVDISVEWYLNDEVIKEDTLSNKTEGFLLEKDIALLKQGDQMKCVVTPCMPGNCSMRGSSRESNVISAKIQVESGAQITLAENLGPALINVTSTVPPHLFCEQSHRDSPELCNPHVSIQLVRGWERTCIRSHVPISQAVFGTYVPHSKPCTYKMTWSSEVLIPVKATLDGIVDRNQYRNIRVLFTASNVTKLISTVQVTVVDEDRIATCSSINDPHMTTFDNSYYDNYLEGEFVLYRHKTLPYEVRVFYRRCNTVAACNCAVAVKSGDDVILLDVCGPSVKVTTRKPIFTIKMYLNGELTPGTEVISHGGGKTYEVVLPTGARIFVMAGQIISNRQFLNVIMVASTFDFNQTEGLCGTFDGDKSNDLMKRDGSLYTGGVKHPNEFSLSWRVSPDESLFKGDCRSSNSGMVEKMHYCDCLEGETAMCQERIDVMTCAEIEKRRGLLNGQKGVKLITQDLINDAETPPARCGSTKNKSFEYDPEYRQPIPEWPTASNITEPIARNFCTHFLENDKAGALCVNLSGIDIDPIMQGCISDIQLTDSTDWAKESLDNLLRECITIIETDDWSNVTRPDVLDIICPNNCLGNGNCSDGLCQCFHPWIGDDCSVNKTVPPELHQVGDGEPCDSVCSECLSVRLYGENFADLENLTCHYRILNLSLEPISDVTSIKAEYFNSHMAKCTLQEIAFYEIAVSNDGEIISDYIKYIVYSSHCHRCNSSWCTKRNDVCKINDECQEHGFVNPTNTLEFCNVTLSKLQWSRFNDENIPMKSYTFQHVSGQFVITRESRLFVGGTGLPTLTESLNRKALVLNGYQYLSLGGLLDTSTCFGDVEESSFGITITLVVKLSRSVSTCFVLSSGGEEVSHYGYAMWLENDSLYAKASNSRHEWVVSTSSVKMEEFIHIQMIWSLQSGLQLTIDSNTITSSKNCISRPESNYAPLKEFVIGGSSKKDQNCKLAIERLTFVCASGDNINTTNSTDLPVTERTTTVGILTDKPCEESTSSATALEAAVISTSILSGVLFCTVCCVFLFFGCKRRRKKKRYNHIESLDQCKTEQTANSKRAALNPVFEDDSGTSAYRHHWTGETPLWRVYRYAEHNRIRINTQNNGMTNSNSVRAHEAETRFPLGTRYSNAVYGFSSEPSTGPCTRTTNGINTRHVESTRCILLSGISSTDENGHVPTFYQRRPADKVPWIQSPSMKNELDVSTTSKRDCHEQIEDSSRVRSFSESNTWTSGNQLLPDNTTNKSRIGNQNQNRMMKTVKTKEDTNSSKEKSHVCTNCKGHYEFYEDTSMLGGAVFRKTNNFKDSSCQTESYSEPSGKTRRKIAYTHNDQFSNKNQSENRNNTESRYLYAMSSRQPLPDFPETKLDRHHMLNLVSDKNKEIKHDSMVWSIAEEKQSSQLKKFDVSKKEIMESRDQAECSNQSEIVDSKVYISKEALQEGKQGQEIQVETMWMPSETEEDSISLLSGGTEFEMGEIMEDAEMQRKDGIYKSYEIRTKWIPENTNQTQATFYGPSCNASSEILNFGEMQKNPARFKPDSSTFAWKSAANTQLSKVKLQEKSADELFEMKLDKEVVPRSDMHVLEKDTGMFSTDSQKYLATYNKTDNGKQVNRKYATDKKSESKENESQFPEARSLNMHSGIKEEMYSSVHILNGHQVVRENKKLCNHCHRNLNPESSSLQTSLAMGLGKAKLGTQTGETKIKEQHKIQEHPQSIEMVGHVAAKMHENNQEIYMSSQQLKKTDDSDVLVGSGKMKYQSERIEYSNIKHPSKQIQDFAVGFKKRETLPEDSSHEEIDGYYQSRETMFKYRTAAEESKESVLKDHHSESIVEGSLQKTESVHMSHSRTSSMSKIDVPGNEWTREPLNTSDTTDEKNHIYTTYTAWKVDFNAHK